MNALTLEEEPRAIDLAVTDQTLNGPDADGGIGRWPVLVDTYRMVSTACRGHHGRTRQLASTRRRLCNRVA